MPEIHEIHTSCGKIFNMTVGEMSERQLASLIRQNQDSEAIPELNAELARRREQAERASLVNIKKSLERWAEDFEQRASDRLPGMSESLPIATPLTCEDAYEASRAMSYAAQVVGDLLALRQEAA